MSFKSIFKRIIKSRAARAAMVFSLIFGSSAALTYVGMPLLKPSKGSDPYDDDNLPIVEMSSADRFVSKLTSTSGIEGTLNFKVSFPSGSKNTISTFAIKDADVKLALPSSSSLGLDFKGTISYSRSNEEISKEEAIHVNYCDKDAYIDFLGAKIAYLDSEYKAFIGELIGTFSDSAIKVPDKIYDLFDNLGSIFGGSGSQGDVSSTSMRWETIKEEENDREFKCTIGMADNSLILNFEADSLYNLKRVVAHDLKIGDIRLDLDFMALTKSDVIKTIRSLVPANKEDYTSLLGFKGIIRKIGKAIAKESFNIDVGFRLSKDIGGVVNNLSFSADGSIDIKNRKYLMDFSLKNLDEETSSAKNIGVYFLEGEDSGIGYLNYNDIIKASMGKKDLEAILSRIKKDTSTLSSLTLNKVLSFAFDSKLAELVREGRYDELASVIEKVESSQESILIKAKLDKLGLGKDSTITIEFDGTPDKPMVGVTIEGVAVKGLSLSGKIKVSDFESKEKDLSSYSTLERLPDVYDQFSKIASEKKASAKIKGTLSNGKDTDQFIGDFSFDASKKVGSGEVSLKQGGKEKRGHIVTMDYSDKTLFLNYKNGDKGDQSSSLKGKTSSSSMLDVVKNIASLRNDENFKSRFGSYFSSLNEMAASSLIAKVLSGHYTDLLSAGILKSCHILSSKIEISIAKEALNLPSDPKIVIEFDDSLVPNENGSTEMVRKVKTLSIEDFSFGENVVNLSLEILPFDGKLKRLDHSLDYMDFSSISLLSENLINTSTRLGTYHLKADFSVILWTMDVLDFGAEFWVKLDEGKGIKIYGRLSGIPLIPALNNGTWLFGDHGEGASYYREVTFYYDGEHVYLHGVNPFGVFEGEDPEGNHKSFDLTETIDRKYSPSYFASTDNILHFLLKDVLNLQDRHMSKVAKNGLSLPNSAPSLNFEHLLSGFSYDASLKKWDLTADLGSLLGNDFLKDLEMTIYGSESGYLEGLDLSLMVFAGVRIDVGTSVKLLDVGFDSFPESSFEDYINAHRLDEAQS